MSISNKEVLALLRIGLDEETDLSGGLIESLQGGSLPKNNTLVRSLAGQPVNTELSDNGGLSQGTPTVQGVTAGETAPLP